MAVDEPAKVRTVEILQDVNSSLIRHCKKTVLFKDELLSVVVKMAEMYSNSQSHRPDNVITLLKRIFSSGIIIHIQKEIPAKTDSDLAHMPARKPHIKITRKSIEKSAVISLSGNTKAADCSAKSLHQALEEIQGQGI